MAKSKQFKHCSFLKKKVKINKPSVFSLVENRILCVHRYIYTKKHHESGRVPIQGRRTHVPSAGVSVALLTVDESVILRYKQVTGFTSFHQSSGYRYC